MGWVVNATPRPLYPRGRNLVPTLQEAGWAPGAVWTGAENLAPPPHSDVTTKLICMYVHTWKIFFWTPACFFDPERYYCHMSFCIHYHLCTGKYMQTHLKLFSDKSKEIRPNMNANLTKLNLREQAPQRPEWVNSNLWLSGTSNYPQSPFIHARTHTHMVSQL